MTKSNGWTAAIGLEIHVQLNTKSKMFSSAPVDSKMAPNTGASIVDLGFPGTLPVLNKAAVRKAVRFGLAIDASIATTCRFDRKHYFYPDLPKGYQITQYYEPLIRRGTLEVVQADGSIIPVKISRAHLEEDAGKLIHDRYENCSAVDFNRAGVPLLEIVTDPEMQTAEEASSFFRQLRNLVMWLDVCDGDLSQGSMRCDANVSIKDPATQQLNEYAEIKNLNSFKFVQQAIQYEIDRQISLLEAGETIERETRWFDETKGTTGPLRSKERFDEYRYLPDPDLPKLSIPGELIDTLQNSLPELPTARRQRYTYNLGLDKESARQLSDDRLTSDFFEETLATCSNAKLVAKWVLGPVRTYLKQARISASRIPVSPSTLGIILCNIQDEALSHTLVKLAFDRALSTGEPVELILAEFQRRSKTDEHQMHRLIESVLNQNSELVAQFHDGKKKVLEFLVGQAIKATGDHADPATVAKAVRERLE